MKVSTLTTTPLTQVSHNAAINKQVLIANGDIEHITNFSQAVFPPGEVANAHSHPDMVEVFFVQQGNGEMQIDDQCLALSAGMCITVEINERHEIRNTSTKNLVISYFGVST